MSTYDPIPPAVRAARDAFVAAAKAAGLAVSPLMHTNDVLSAGDDVVLDYSGTGEVVARYWPRFGYAEIIGRSPRSVAEVKSDAVQP